MHGELKFECVGSQKQLTIPWKSTVEAGAVDDTSQAASIYEGGMME